MTRTVEPPTRVATQLSSARRVRRWVRRRRAERGPALSLESAYVLLLTVAVTVAMIGPRLGSALWPADAAPASDRFVVVVLLGAGAAGLVLLLRQMGPLVLGRGELTWLLPTPVGRRGLLLPALVRVLAVGVVAGAVLASTGSARLATRPVTGPALAGWLVLGTAVGVLLALFAVAAQRRTTYARVADAVLPALLVVAGATVLFARVRALPSLPVVTVPLPFALAALAAAVALTVLTVRDLERFPDVRLHEPSLTVGTYLDAAYAVEPSFVADLRERRYWRRRALRSLPLRPRRGRLVPLQHDLLVLRRRGWRSGWLFATAALPALLSTGSDWLPVATLVVGAVTAAGVTLGGLRRDAAQPALLRLLGLTGQRAVAIRLVVPAVLATAWSGLAMLTLGMLGGLPPGPWWALGVAFGPTAAMIAVRRAQAGRIDNALPLLETPMGAFPPGPVLWLLNGSDVLMFAAPTLLALLGPTSPGWGWVGVQAALSAAAVLAYLYFGVDRRRPQV
ncbi:DUF6297 family protein [Micromonospora lutea]|uniref:ABC-2 type transport system permease protein n=1 Tax=Micromonospora lutea TaxID=419825 RepID=A0ABQ4IT90_9ACTN|nr:DUF6297 family protein [Micromonospora lutea]GIJ21142.1 hypothetical protein Vlu01_17660 [Micromonospora lutea]